MFVLLCHVDGAFVNVPLESQRLASSAKPSHVELPPGPVVQALEPPSFLLEDRVAVELPHTPVVSGVVKYIGPVDNQEGSFYGIVLDEPRGKNDGSVQQKRYFDAPPMHGIFVKHGARNISLRLLHRAAAAAPQPSVPPADDSLLMDGWGEGNPFEHSNVASTSTVVLAPPLLTTTQTDSIAEWGSPAATTIHDVVFPSPSSTSTGIDDWGLEGPSATPIKPREEEKQVVATPGDESLFRVDPGDASLFQSPVAKVEGSLFVETPLADISLKEEETPLSTVGKDESLFPVELNQSVEPVVARELFPPAEDVVSQRIRIDHLPEEQASALARPEVLSQGSDIFGVSMSVQSNHEGSFLEVVGPAEAVHACADRVRDQIDQQDESDAEMAPMHSDFEQKQEAVDEIKHVVENIVPVTEASGALFDDLVTIEKVEVKEVPKEEPPKHDNAGDLFGNVADPFENVAPVVQQEAPKTTDAGDLFGGGSASADPFENLASVEPPKPAAVEAKPEVAKPEVAKPPGPREASDLFGGGGDNDPFASIGSASDLFPGDSSNLFGAPAQQPTQFIPPQPVAPKIQQEASSLFGASVPVKTVVVPTVPVAVAPKPLPVVASTRPAEMPDLFGNVGTADLFGAPAPRPVATSNAPVVKALVTPVVPVSFPKPVVPTPAVGPVPVPLSPLPAKTVVPVPASPVFSKSVPVPLSPIAPKLAVPVPVPVPVPATKVAAVPPSPVKVPVPVVPVAKQPIPHVVPVPPTPVAVSAKQPALVSVPTPQLQQAAVPTPNVVAPPPVVKAVPTPLFKAASVPVPTVPVATTATPPVPVAIRPPTFQTPQPVFKPPAVSTGVPLPPTPAAGPAPALPTPVFSSVPPAAAAPSAPRLAPISFGSGPLPSASVAHAPVTPMSAPAVMSLSEDSGDIFGDVPVESSDFFPSTGSVPQQQQQQQQYYQDFMAPPVASPVRQAPVNFGNAYEPQQHRSDTKPPVPIWIWGFGGRCGSIFLRPGASWQGQGKMVSGPVNLFRMNTITAKDQDLTLAASFPGPLRSRASKSQVVAWIRQRIAVLSQSGNYPDWEDEMTLWEILRIMCENDGEIRSANLKQLTDAHKELIALLRKSELDHQRVYGGVATEPIADYSRLEVIQSLMMEGKQTEALKEAAHAKLWSHALFLTAFCPDQELCQSIRSQFANEACQVGSPMRAVFLMLSGQMGSLLNAPPEAATLGRWRESAAAILSNGSAQTSATALGVLGDGLWSRQGRVHAAHACYVMAQAQFLPVSDPHARLVLLGGDHKRRPSSFVNCGSIQRSEIWEFAKALGNTQFSCPELERYKLSYAMVLAELGEIDKAFDYCKAIHDTLTHNPAVFKNDTLFMNSFKDFEDRLVATKPGLRAAGGTSLLRGVGSFFGGALRAVVGGDDSPPPKVAPQPVAPRARASSTGAAPVVPQQPVIQQQPQPQQQQPAPQQKAPAKKESEEESEESEGWGFWPFGRKKTKEVKLGGTLERYYNEELKKWVRPGEEEQMRAQMNSRPPTDMLLSQKKEAVAPAYASPTPMATPSFPTAAAAPRPTPAVLPPQPSFGFATPSVAAPTPTTAAAVAAAPAPVAASARGPRQRRYVDTFNNNATPAAAPAGIFPPTLSPAIPTPSLSVTPTPVRLFVPAPVPMPTVAPVEEPAPVAEQPAAQPPQGLVEAAPAPVAEATAPPPSAEVAPSPPPIVAQEDEFL